MTSGRCSSATMRCYLLQHVYTGRGRVAFWDRMIYACGDLSSFQVTSYFPDQDSLVTVLRYRVVIDEIVVSKKKFDDYNLQAGVSASGFGKLGETVEDFLETKNNKFQNWGWGSPSLMSNPSDFVGELGEGYVAFKGNVTTGSDDLFPGNYNSWSHDEFDPIPLENND